jgi:hypothetical protein
VEESLEHMSLRPAQATEALSLKQEEKKNLQHGDYNFKEFRPGPW